MENDHRSAVQSVVLLQVAIADYRNAFMQLLAERLPSLHVEVGPCYFEETTRTSEVVKRLPATSVIENKFVFRRRLCWQKISWRTVLQADVLVGELNPRILSNWPALVLRKVMRKRTILWGHAWSRSGANSSTELLRHLMRKLSDGVLLYTNEQRSELVRRYSSLGAACFVAPNSLYRTSEMQPAVLDHPTDFVYVGRMVASKKVKVLVEAFALFRASHSESRLHLVGDGDELPVLKQMVAAGIRGVDFYGHVSDPERLKQIYATCVTSISPGYVGLSITQSFSFGVPMIVSRDEPHSPEIEAFVEGLNGSFFDTDDPRSLCAEMEFWYKRRSDARARAESIVEHCRASYSVERMVDGFCKAATG